MAWLCCSTTSCSVARVLLLLTVDSVSPFRLSQAASPKLTALPLMNSIENFRVRCMRFLYYPLQLCFPLRARVILFLFQCQVPQGLCICLLENMFCFDVCFSNGLVCIIPSAAKECWIYRWAITSQNTDCYQMACRRPWLWMCMRVSVRVCTVRGGREVNFLSLTNFDILYELKELDLSVH